MYTSAILSSCSDNNFEELFVCKSFVQVQLDQPVKAPSFQDLSVNAPSFQVQVDQSQAIQEECKRKKRDKDTSPCIKDEEQYEEEQYFPEPWFRELFAREKREQEREEAIRALKQLKRPRKMKLAAPTRSGLRSSRMKLRNQRRL